VRWIALIVSAVLLIAGALAAYRYISSNRCQWFNATNTQYGTADGILSVMAATVDLNGDFGVQLSDSPTTGNLPSKTRAIGNAYKITACGAPPKALTLSLKPPAGFQINPANAPDMLAYFNDKGWQWVGSTYNAGANTLTTKLNEMPTLITLAQLEASARVLSIELPATRPSDEVIQRWSAQASAGWQVEYVAPVFYLGDYGAVAGDRAALVNSPNVIPMMRNWSDKGEINRGLLRQMLASATSRQSHIANLLNVLASVNSSSIVVDYRGVDVAQADSYSAFLVELAAALNKTQKQLIVGVPAPMLRDNAWSSGVYDLRTISNLAVRVRVDLGATPSAMSGESLDGLMNWLLSQVSRNKLQIASPASSLRASTNSQPLLLTLDEALAPLGRLDTEQALPSAVLPGTTLKFRLRGAADLRNAQFDDAAQTLRYTYIDASGVQQTSWVISLEGVRRRIGTLTRYGTAGVALRGLDWVDPLAAQTALDNQPSLFVLPQLAWQVTSNNGTQPTSKQSRLDDLAFSWIAPKDAGSYLIQAILFATQPIERGALVVTVDPNAAPIASAIQSSTTTNSTTNGNAQSSNVAGAGNIELGGHVVGLTNLTRMSQSGMTWVKITVNDFADPTRFIAVAHGQQMKVLVNAIGNKSQVMDENYQNQWAQHLANIAAQGADAIEVWSEMNSDVRWSAGNISGANYAKLLSKVYLAVKARNANTQVITGALFPTNEFNGGCTQNGCDDSAYLTQMAQAGVSNYADCIGVRYTYGSVSPSQTNGARGGSHYSWYFGAMRDLYYAAFGGVRKVCFTDIGYLSPEGMPTLPRSYEWAASNTDDLQASWLAESVSLARNGDKISMMIIWNVDFPTRRVSNADPSGDYAIIRPNNTCPACDALRDMMVSR
jgi:hypothetical protein